MPKNAIRLLLIDDSITDRVLEQLQLQKAFKELVVDTLPAPPNNLTEVLSYDGLVLDENLSDGVSGSDVALRVHNLDWRLPIMIIAGGADSKLLKRALNTVDYVANKDDIRDMILNVQLFVRQISRIKEARGGN